MTDEIKNFFPQSTKASESMLEVAKTKVHLVTILVVDHDKLGAEQIKVEMESVRYPNYCIINPSVMKIETREVVWSDEHPLNYDNDAFAEEVKKLFGENA